MRGYEVVFGDATYGYRFEFKKGYFKHASDAIVTGLCVLKVFDETFPYSIEWDIPEEAFEVPLGIPFAIGTANTGLEECRFYFVVRIFNVPDGTTFLRRKFSVALSGTQRVKVQLTQDELKWAEHFGKLIEQGGFKEQTKVS